MGRLSVFGRVFLYLSIIQGVAACDKAPENSYMESEAAQKSCMQLAAFAKSVMKKHQDNVLISDVFKEVDSMSEVPNDSKELLKEITIEAYRHGVFTDQSFNERQLVEFSNDVHIKCLDTMK